MNVGDWKAGKMVRLINEVKNIMNKTDLLKNLSTRRRMFEEYLKVKTPQGRANPIKQTEDRPGKLRKAGKTPKGSGA